MEGLGNGDREKFVWICHKKGTRGPENVVRQKLHLCVRATQKKGLGEANGEAACGTEVCKKSIASGRV